MKKFIIAADISLRAPLHITSTESGKYDPQSGRILRYDAPTGVGCSLTRTVPLAELAQASTHGSGNDIPRVPTIPASTVGGKLRRAAAALLHESMVKRSLQLSPNAYNMMTTGMATTDLNADAATPEVVRAARLDPFLGCFGGSSFALSANTVVSEGWPLLEITSGRFMTEPILPVSQLAKLNEMTSAMAIVRKNDVAELKASILDQLIGVEALANFFEAEGTARTKSKANKDAGESGKKTDLRTFNAAEVVNSGLSFGLRVAVVSRTPAHIGLMILAVQKMLRDGQIGGKRARGLGSFVCPAGASRLYDVDPATGVVSGGALLFGEQASGYGVQESAFLDECITAAQDYIDECDPRLYEAFASVNAKAIKALMEAVQ